MRSSPLLLLPAVLVLAACPGDAPPAEPETPSAVERNDFAGDDGFIVLQGMDTIAVERYTRGGDALEGQILDVRDGQRLRYRLGLDEDGRVTRMEVEAFAAEGGSARTRVVHEIRGDTLFAEMHTEGAEPETDRVVVTRRTFAHLGPSIATLEQLIRFVRGPADEAGEGEEEAETRTELPILIVGHDYDTGLSPVERVSVTWVARDSVHVLVNRENQFLGAVDGEGRIRHGMNPALDVRVQRIDP